MQSATPTTNPITMSHRVIRLGLTYGASPIAMPRHLAVLDMTPGAYVAVWFVRHHESYFLHCWACCRANGFGICRNTLLNACAAGSASRGGVRTMLWKRRPRPRIILILSP